uniref:Uncharacterized protein n=1 Tax=Trichobilharzia regenti TaxID=157069 RepID=A0AA85K0W6_TRIRE|nr:unnamed protein product [Trichobilharzia regenti]
MDTTLNITNMLMKDTTPELINRSFAPRKNDPLSMSCPPISSSSKLNQFKYSPTSFNKNNTSIQSDTGSEIDISPSPHNHSYDSNTSKPSDVVTLNQEVISTPQQAEQNQLCLYHTPCQYRTPDYHPINYNDRIQRDGLKSNSSSSVSLPATDYYSTPKTAHNYLCYTKGINSQNNGSNSSSSSSIVTTQSILTPVMNSNEQHKFKIPSYSVVLKSSQTNKSRMKFNSFTPTETITRSDNTNTNLRKRLIQHSINHGVDDSQWDESQESSIQEKLQQQDQHLCNDTQIFQETETEISIDYSLINDGWSELACLIRISKLGLLDIDHTLNDEDSVADSSKSTEKTNDCIPTLEEENPSHKRVCYSAPPTPNPRLVNIENMNFYETPPAQSTTTTEE